MIRIFHNAFGIFLLGAIFSFEGISASTSTRLPAPKAFYHFDESAGRAPGASAEYQVTGASEEVSGHVGRALHFPRRDDTLQQPACGVLLPYEGKFFANPFTISFWVLLDKEWLRTTYNDFFSLGPENGPGFRLTLFYGCLRLITGNGKKAAFVGLSEMHTSLPRERWTHLALVYDGQTAAFFRDGELLMQDAVQLTEGKGRLTLSSLQNGSAYPMQGAMDEVRIYDQALSPGQVTELYISELQ